VPFWVVLSAHFAIGLGTLAGGWRIIHTMGSKITKLQPVGGFAAETGAALSILIATQTGVPVSTTHAITGAIVGVGRDAAAVGGPVGRRRPDCVGLGPDDSHGVRDRRTPPTGWCGCSARNSEQGGPKGPHYDSRTATHVAVLLRSRAAYVRQP
jgi:hypothetical protein